MGGCRSGVAGAPGCAAAQVYLAHDLEGLVHVVVTHMRGVLGHSNNHHNWYRVALTGASNVAATIFDDLTQVRRG